MSRKGAAADAVATARKLLVAEGERVAKAMKGNRKRSRAPLVRRLHEVRQMLNTNYHYTSQAGQDFIVDQMMKQKRYGTFVDVGAYDGVTGSNTHFLEAHRGWTGVMVEPVPSQAAKAKRARTAPCLSLAVAANDGEADFIEVTDGYTQMSGLADTYDAKLLDTVRGNKKHKENVLKVQTKTLTSILEDSGIVDPDYISLDIEGGELACLSSFPFDKHDVKIWSVENNTGTPEIKALMESKGYDLIEFCGPDEMYFKRSP